MQGDVDPARVWTIRPGTPKAQQDAAIMAFFTADQTAAGATVTASAVATVTSPA